MGHFYVIFFLALFLFTGKAVSVAQFFNPKCKYTSVGFSVKASYFDGDIKTPLQYVRPGLGVCINRRTSPRITLWTEAMWVRLMGDDYAGSNLQTAVKVPVYVRNLHFRNDVKEIAAGFKYDLFPSPDHYRKRPLYNIYGSIGLGFFYHNPKAKAFTDSSFTKTRWVALRPLQTENVKYSNFQLAIPLAAGIRYKLSLHWDVEAELSYRLTFTDYMDDVSGNYPDPSTLKSALARQLAFRSADPRSALSNRERDLAAINTLGYNIIQQGSTSYVEGSGPGTKRGSQKGSDRYVVFNIRFLYAIPGRVNCPKFRDLY